MNIRHSFIRWLSFGDMIILNAEFLSDGTIRSREAGGNIVTNLHVSSDKAFGLSFGARPPRAALTIETTPTQQLSLRDVSIDCSRSRRTTLVKSAEASNALA